MGSNVPRTVPFLTGSSQGLALNAKSLILPKLIVLLLQIASEPAIPSNFPLCREPDIQLMEPSAEAVKRRALEMPIKTSLV